jgi:hypothetical protein
MIEHRFAVSSRRQKVVRGESMPEARYTRAAPKLAAPGGLGRSDPVSLSGPVSTDRLSFGRPGPRAVLWWPAAMAPG